MYHEELESLHASFPEIKQMRFWMTFSEEYLTFLRALQIVGMTRIDPVSCEGNLVASVKLLKELLPKGENYNESYTGKPTLVVLCRELKMVKNHLYLSSMRS